MSRIAKACVPISTRYLINVIRLSTTSSTYLDLEPDPIIVALWIHARHPRKFGRLQVAVEADFFQVQPNMHVADEAYWIADVCNNADYKTGGTSSRMEDIKVPYIEPPLTFPNDHLYHGPRADQFQHIFLLNPFLATAGPSLFVITHHPF